MSGPLPEFLRPFTRPAAWVYGAAVARRNARFDRGQGITRLDRPVISIGNITTGGTGKSPMVAWIARRLVEARLEPLIAMRGYKARRGEMGDEETEYREMLPDPHVAANPDRLNAIRTYLAGHGEVKCVILDDGFQHRRIARDLDIVLIDAASSTFQDRLLPAGNLREPLENLKRADAVIVTHADSVTPALQALIEQFHGRAPLAWTRHRWTHVTVFEHDARPERREVGWLRDKRVVTMLGVGKPESVLKQVQLAGATVLRNIPAADHHRYDHDDLETIEIAAALEHGGAASASDIVGASRCDALLVTGKDWVKLRGLINWSSWALPIVVPRLEIEVVTGEAALRERIMDAAGKATASGSAR